MAGGKLTPRQKMINMMYLVLTALLALNVSKEVLEAFNLIADSLKESANQFSEKNHDLGLQIKGAVEKEKEEGNNTHEHLPAKVDAVIAKTDGLITYMDTLISKMYSEEVGGRDEETGKLKRPDEVEKNYRFWMFPPKGEEGNDASNGGRGAGEAKKLRDELNAYVDWANKMLNELNADSTGKPGNEVYFQPIAQNFEGEGGPNDPTNVWEYKIFHNTPAAANVAMIQKFKTDVNVIEASILENIRLKLQDVPFKIDSLILRDAPESRVVAAGGQFITELFVTTSSSQAQPKYSGSGAIRVKPGGQSADLVINTTLPTGLPPGATVERGYTATATVPSSSGPKVLTLNGKYKIAAPLLDIDAEGGSILYAGCCNDYSMKVIVPGATGTYTPIPALSNGGRVQPNPQKGANFFTLVPGQSRNATLVVSTRVGGTTVKVGEKKFQITQPPDPTVVFFVNGSVWNGTNDFPRGGRIEMGVAANQDFARALPNDAKYQLRNVQVFAKVGLSPLQPVGGARNSGVGVRVRMPIAISQNVPSGAQVTIRAEGCVRVNCRNQPIPVKLPPNALSASARLN